jgi:hypothetical protein
MANMATHIENMEQQQQQQQQQQSQSQSQSQGAETLPQLPLDVWHYMLGFLGIRERLAIDMLLMVTGIPRHTGSVLNTLGTLWCTNIYTEATRPRVPAAIKWLSPDTEFRDILWNIRPTEDNVSGMWRMCLRSLRPESISRLMAHDIMCAMCSVPWFSPEYAEQLCNALSMCHRNTVDSSWPRGSINQRTGLQYGYYMEYNARDNIYSRKRRAPFDMDETGVIVPDFAHYEVDRYRRSVADGDGWDVTPVICYRPTGAVSLDLWLSIGSVFVAACEACNLVAAKWLVERFPDYFHDVVQSTCALEGARQRTFIAYDKNYSGGTIAQYNEIRDWIDWLLDGGDSDSD